MCLCVCVCEGVRVCACEDMCVERVYVCVSECVCVWMPVRVL